MLSHNEYSELDVEVVKIFYDLLSSLRSQFSTNASGENKLLRTAERKGSAKNGIFGRTISQILFIDIYI
jgi:hypothetical protein